jgi:hypothetical protein
MKDIGLGRRQATTRVDTHKNGYKIFVWKHHSAFTRATSKGRDRKQIKLTPEKLVMRLQTEFISLITRCSVVMVINRLT